MRCLLFFGLFILCSTLVFADGNEAATNSADNSKNSFDARHDKRLPPVIPGEEVKDGNKTIKMWSTSGVVESEEFDEDYDDKHILEKIDDLDIEVDRDSERSEKRR